MMLCAVRDCSRFWRSMFMFKIIAVTNRKLCSGSLTDQAEIICRRKPPQAIILREKDLSSAEYGKLACNVLKVCRKYHVPLILHSFWQCGILLECYDIHLPLSLLQSAEFQQQRHLFKHIGASVHSMEEARIAEAWGATYLSAGHIYETDCKQGIPGRGLDFLRQLCENTSLPVYAIGGVKLNGSQFKKLQACQAAGACIMSDYMLLK